MITSEQIIPILQVGENSFGFRYNVLGIEEGAIMTVNEIIFLSMGILFIVGSIIAAVINHEKKRRQGLEEFARYQGFTYQKKADPVANPGNLKLFGKGRMPKVKNRISGSRSGIQYEIFDYQYTEGGGQNSATHRQTVALAVSQGLAIPRFYLAPENIFHKIGKKFGMQDINFDHFPEFSEYYLLKGDEEAAVRKLFTPGVLDFFQGNKMKQSLEGEGNRLIFYRINKREKAEDFADFFEKFRHIVSLFHKR